MTRRPRLLLKHQKRMPLCVLEPLRKLRLQPRTLLTLAQVQLIKIQAKSLTAQCRIQLDLQRLSLSQLTALKPAAKASILHHLLQASK